jgi:Na+-driven multidrug efflux pump
LFIFADPITAAFASSDKISPEMLSTCAWCIRLQAIALPIHSWVALVNMLCAGLGNAGGALALSTARQGSCMLPILYPMVFFFGTLGLASVQALADVLSLALAIPICLYMVRKIKAKQAEVQGHV